MLCSFDIYFKLGTPPFFFLGTGLLAVTLTFGEVHLITAKQNVNIFLQKSSLLFSRHFRPLICTDFS